MSKQHITQADIDTFIQDHMSPKDRMEFLEHISSCNHCSELFAVRMSEDIIPAPRDLKANILKASKRPEVILAAKAKETSKRMQLFLYSLKVGTATIGALLLLLLSMNFTDYTADTENTFAVTTGVSSVDKDNKDKVPITKTIRNSMDTISSSILDFSNAIMNTEVLNND